MPKVSKPATMCAVTDARPDEREHDRRRCVDRPERLAPVEAERQRPGVERHQVDVLAHQQLEHRGRLLHDREREARLAGQRGVVRRGGVGVVAQHRSALPLFGVEVAWPGRCWSDWCRSGCRRVRCVRCRQRVLADDGEVPTGIMMFAPTGRLLTSVMIAATRSMKSSLGPPASVLNVFASVIRVTSSPPARCERSDSTGIGA